MHLYFELNCMILTAWNRQKIFRWKDEKGNLFFKRNFETLGFYISFLPEFLRVTIIFDSPGLRIFLLRGRFGKNFGCPTKFCWMAKFSCNKQSLLNPTQNIQSKNIHMSKFYERIFVPFQIDWLVMMTSSWMWFGRKSG